MKHSLLAKTRKLIKRVGSHSHVRSIIEYKKHWFTPRPKKEETIEQKNAS